MNFLLLKVWPVNMNSVTMLITGVYTCEVSTEGTFETVEQSSKMVVVQMPRGGPHIQGYAHNAPQTTAEIGDEISLNCTSLKSKPAAKLSFYVNGKATNKHNKLFKLHHYTINNKEERVQTSSSVLSLVFQ